MQSFEEVWSESNMRIIGHCTGLAELLLVAPIVLRRDTPAMVLAWANLIGSIVYACFYGLVVVSWWYSPQHQAIVCAFFPSLCYTYYCTEIALFVSRLEVFHLAALISYTRKDREAMFFVNVEGTRNVAEACASTGVRLVHVSSMGAIGASPDDQMILNEDSTFNLGQYDLGYCESKRKSEKVVLELQSNSNLNVVIVNPCNVYGAGDALKSSRKTQMKVALGKFPLYTSGGVNVVHVDDVVDGLIAAWKRGRAGERYIIGGENISVRGLFELISAETKVVAPFIYLPLSIQLFLGKLGFVPLEKVIPANMYTWFSSEKAERELGYKARWSAEEAIRDSVNFMKTNMPQFKEQQQKSSSFMKIVAAAMGTSLLAYVLWLRK